MRTRDQPICRSVGPRFEWRSVTSVRFGITDRVDKPTSSAVALMHEQLGSPGPPGDNHMSRSTRCHQTKPSSRRFHVQSSGTRFKRSNRHLTEIKPQSSCSRVEAGSNAGGKGVIGRTSTRRAKVQRRPPGPLLPATCHLPPHVPTAHQHRRDSTATAACAKHSGRVAAFGPISQHTT